MKGLILTLILVLSAYHNVLVKADENADPPQFKLYRKLFDRYQVIRPVRTWSSSIQVKLRIGILQIQELSSAEQKLSIIATFQMVWNDEFLQWNSTENGIDGIVLPARKIWTPDFFIINSGSGHFIDSQWRDNYDVKVKPGGDVYWSTGGLTVVSCNVSIIFFPFDIQNCSIRISTWSETSSSLNLTLLGKGIEKMYYQENSEWKLLSTFVTDSKSERKDGKFVRTILEASLILQRRSQSYMIGLICPIFLLFFMGTLIFALPPDSGEKISLGVTTMLGFSVFQLVISDKLPQSSQDTPIIMIILFTLMTLNGVSIILSIFILFLHHTESAPKLPTWLKLLTFNVLGRLVCKTTSQKIAPTDKPDDIELETFDSSPEGPKHEQGKNEATSQNGSDLVILVSKILNEVKNLVQRKELEDEQDGNLADWHKAASILDRVFFCMFSLIFLTILTVAYFVLW